MKHLFTLLLLIPFSNPSLWGQFNQIGAQLDGNSPNDNFGWAVAMDQSGKTIAVGAPLFDNDWGQVRVYFEFGGIWTQVGNDIDGTEIGHQFGFSLALSADGKTLALGGLSGNPSTLGGHARVYRLTAGQWVQLGNTIAGEVSGDQFGFSLDLSATGNRLIVGGRNNNGNGNNSGHVRVFEFQNNDWVQLGDDIDGDMVDDRLGTGVSINADGTIIAASTPLHSSGGSSAGQVKVWQWQNDNWVQLGSDILGMGPGETFGSMVALSEDGLSFVSSAPAHDHGNGFGSVRVYQFDNGSWTQVGADMRASSTSEAFGTAVTISGNGNRVAVGTQSADDVAMSSGRVNQFELINGTWTELYSPITGQAQFDNLGKSVALNHNGSRVAIGANLAGGTQGYTSVYEDSQMPVSIASLRERLGLVIEQDIQAGTLVLRFAERQTEVSATLFDIQGRQVGAQSASFTESIKLDYSFPAGVYLLHIQTPEGVATQKIILL
ncbi:MAG: T9SS type A sorting domain-containing protein [Bacteroidia bacterium]